jgi:hypothetical protein
LISTASANTRYRAEFSPDDAASLGATGDRRRRLGQRHVGNGIPVPDTSEAWDVATGELVRTLP